MSFRAILLSFFITFYSALNIFAQTYPLGLTPSSLKWMQIDNEEMQVVYPIGVENQAQRVANLIHYLKNNNLTSIGEKTEKITFILQNQTITPNGFVALSPFRSELFLTPPQFNFLGSGDWLDILTIHEYRHVLQTTNAKKGITGFASFLLGENTLAAMRRIALPRWYLEGDAVGVETALTHAGRGRLPHFDMEYRAMRLANMKHNYEKASAFSLKDYVPDHYNLGYYLTTWARNNYGEDIWQKSLGEAVKYNNFFPLSSALKKFTDHRTPSLYKATMASLDSTWQTQDSEIKPNRYETITKTDQKKFTNYRNAQYLDNDSWIVEKTSFEEIRTYYRIYRSGKEEKLFSPGFNYTFNNVLSVSNGKVVWAETRFDPRWGSQDFSIIRTANLNGNQKQKLTSESKYFVPTFSPNGQELVVVKTTTDQKYNLVILSASTGAVIRELPNPNNLFFSLPRFTEDGKQIVVITQHQNKHGLALVDVQNGEVSFLINPDFAQLSNPFPKNGKIYFSSTYTGINNIFSIDVQSKVISQLTNSRFGAFQPAVSPDGSHLIYSDYTAMGYELREISLNIQEPLLALSDNNLPESSIDFFKPITEQEGGSILDNVSNEIYESKKFNKLSGFINPHSFQAFPFHPNYSLEVQFENKFQTLDGAVGYSFNVNENAGGFYANVAYGQFFPVIEAGMRLNDERNRIGHSAYTFVRNDTINGFQRLFNKTWKEDNIFAGVTIPLNLTQGNHISSLRLSGYYHYFNVNYENRFFSEPATEDPEDFLTLRLEEQNGPVNAMEFRLRYNRSQIRAVQHINSRFAQSIDIRYRSTFISTRNKGDVFTVNSNFFFPGLFRTHSLLLGAAYQNEGINESYQFRDNFVYPRGYQSLQHDEIYRYSFNYALPLFYPDLAAGPLAFFQRIRLNGFFDLGLVRNKNRRFLDFEYLLGTGNKSRLAFPETINTFKSFGAELTFDFRLIRLLDASMGVRYSYLMDVEKTIDPTRNNHQFDFIILSLGG